MKRILWTLWLVTGALRAQAPRAHESLSAWLYFKEIQAPRTAGGLLDFVLDREMLDTVRANHGDIRLFDAAGKEIPYVPRVRREIDTAQAFNAREFNRGSDGNSALVSYDLGERPQQHNEVDIEMSGANFRRLADVQGSSDGNQWSTLAAGAILFRFTAGGKTVEQRSVTYPVSRYRYLRVRVERDAQMDREAPEVKSVQIRRSVRVQGEMATFPGILGGREPDRLNGRPASIWRVDFGAYIPIERILITVSDPVFSRPFQLEGIDVPAAPVMLASGDLVRRADDPERQPEIDFSERRARHVKLTVTDDRNPVLSIVALTARSAAREVVFEADAATAGPIRAYYGNTRALEPHYDLAARLPANIEPSPRRLELGPQRPNPTYSPEPVPLSERLPWLVYVVLGAAGIVLAAILLSLVRRSAAEAAAA